MAQVQLVEQAMRQRQHQNGRDSGHQTIGNPCPTTRIARNSKNSENRQTTSRIVAKN